jgi:hypothetical protein
MGLKVLAARAGPATMNTPANVAASTRIAGATRWRASARPGLRNLRIVTGLLLEVDSDRLAGIRDHPPACGYRETTIALTVAPPAGMALTRR